jgi:RHS repeat-associated protein
VTTTTYLDDRTIVQAGGSAAGVPTYFVLNAHADIAGTTDASGTFAPKPAVDEFGTGVSNSSDRLGWLGAKYRFTDQDALVRMGVRLYDPPTGRFLEVDPIEGGCANSYVYVHGDPINAVDLDGRGSCNTRTGSGRVYVQWNAFSVAWGWRVNGDVKRYIGKRPIYYAWNVWVNGKKVGSQKNQPYGAWIWPAVTTLHSSKSTVIPPSTPGHLNEIIVNQWLSTEKGKQGKGAFAFIRCTG